jgi:ribosomal-protein-serine acetyltransferase
MTLSTFFSSTIKVNEHIALQTITLADSTDMYNTINSQRGYLGKWLPFVAFTQQIEDTRNYIRSVLSAPESSREHVFVIRFDGEFAGLVGLKAIDQSNHKTEIGYWLSEPYQKKGIVSNSIIVLARHAYNRLKVNRIQIKCAIGNEPSKNIPQRLGFKLEGIERDGELLSGNVYADIEVYSMLKREFEQLHGL